MTSTSTPTINIQADRDEWESTMRFAARPRWLEDADPRGLVCMEQGCYLKGSRGSHRTPWRPVEDPLDPLQIGNAP